MRYYPPPFMAPEFFSRPDPMGRLWGEGAELWQRDRSGGFFTLSVTSVSNPRESGSTKDNLCLMKAIYVKKFF